MICLYSTNIDELDITHVMLLHKLLHNFYPVNLQHFSFKHVFSTRVETVWILIRWLHQKPSDLDPHGFQIRINLGSLRQGLME